MPMWRCPHCGTPQAETARCWVCRRSSTACGTCRNFRRAVAANLGYCGLDRGRQPLDGGEIRSCWEAGDAATSAPVLAVTTATPRARLDFVEIGVPTMSRAERGERAAGAAIGSPSLPAPGEPGWSLWGDPDA
ncbi:MAG: hypothetical protein ACSLFN_09230 [Candidatus Limnocylindrales bacterium]